MRRHFLFFGLAFAGLAGFALFCGWAFFAVTKVSDGGRSLGPAWPYVLGAVMVACGLASFLMWLAFYAAGHRDEPADKDPPRS